MAGRLRPMAVGAPRGRPGPRRRREGGRAGPTLPAGGIALGRTGAAGRREYPHSRFEQRGSAPDHQTNHKTSTSNHKNNSSINNIKKQQPRRHHAATSGVILGRVRLGRVGSGGRTGCHLSASLRTCGDRVPMCGLTRSCNWPGMRMRRSTSRHVK